MTTTEDKLAWLMEQLLVRFNRFGVSVMLECMTPPGECAMPLETREHLICDLFETMTRKRE